LPVLSDEEYAALRADIIARGIVVPVVIDEQGNVIDGQHRLRIAADLGLVDVPMDIRPGLVDSEREALALDLNLHRRHLSTEQRDKVIVWRRQKGESYRQIAEAVGVDVGTAWHAVRRATVENSTVDLPAAIKGKDGKTRPAKLHKVRVESVRDVARAQEALSILPTEELPNKAIELKRLERIAREYQAEEQRKTPPIAVLTRPNADIRHGDFRTALTDIPDGSVDLFLTDPPYPREYLPLWRDLAALAARTLKPGGLLVAYSGQYYLPAVMGMLAEAHPTFHHIVIQYPQHAEVHALRMVVSGKAEGVVAVKPAVVGMAPAACRV
jgi:site-specific DNA-methyltransferase (adenine-specific)